jgi:hypothetical protein
MEIWVKGCSLHTILLADTVIQEVGRRKLAKGKKGQSPGRAGAFGFFLSAKANRLGFDFYELLSAGLGHGRVRAGASRRGRPPAFLNQLTLLPGCGALEGGEFCRRIGLPHESLHTDGDQDARHRVVSPRFGHLLRGTAQDPSPPRQSRGS